MGPYSNTSCFLVGTDSGPPSPAPETRLPSPRVRGCYCPRRDCSLSLSFSLSLSLSLSPQIFRIIYFARYRRDARLFALRCFLLLSFLSIRYDIRSLFPLPAKNRGFLFFVWVIENRSHPAGRSEKLSGS